MDLFVRKNKFTRMLKEQLFLRFHMSLILIGTALTGLLASKLLLMVHVDNIVVRYPLAVAVAYLAFFGFMKLWLMYITSSHAYERCDGDAVSDTLNAIPDFPATGGSISSHETFSGGGGTSGGGGASGSFDTISAHDVVADTAGQAGEGVGDAAGTAASGLVDSDEAGCILVILGLLLAVVFGAGIYLVYNAPLILTEAAFDFVLAASLIKTSRKLDDPDWKGSVLRTTWVPFTIVLVLTFLVAGFICATYPDVHKVSEVFSR